MMELHNALSDAQLNLSPWKFYLFSEKYQYKKLQILYIKYVCLLTWSRIALDELILEFPSLVIFDYISFVKPYSL